MDREGAYTVKLLAEALGINRKAVYSLIEEGLPIHKTGSVDIRKRNVIYGNEAVLFLKKRAAYASIPEMVRITGIAEYHIRDYVKRGLVRTITFGDSVAFGDNGNKTQYILRHNSRKIIEIYNREHTVSMGGTERRSKRRFTNPQEYETIESKVIEIMREERIVGSRYMRRHHSDIYCRVISAGVSWSYFVRQLSEDYKEQGDGEIADAIIKALNRKESYLTKIKQMFPQIRVGKALQIVDIVDEAQPNSQISELIGEVVRAKGEIGADIVLAWKDISDFVEEPHRVLEAVIKRTPLSQHTLEQLLKYRTIHLNNMRILGSEWKAARTEDFKVYMG